MIVETTLGVLAVAVLGVLVAKALNTEGGSFAVALVCAAMGFFASGYSLGVYLVVDGAVERTAREAFMFGFGAWAFTVLSAMAVMLLAVNLKKVDPKPDDDPRSNPANEGEVGDSKGEKR
ncbi:hypothetical protein [Algiphilus sp.]|uniref:hypothetical protein n=1 Tax=Algiphilus sp. TaxID=1872431 RepID=UPI003CCBFF38